VYRSQDWTSIDQKATGIVSRLWRRDSRPANPVPSSCCRPPHQWGLPHAGSP